MNAVQWTGAGFMVAGGLLSVTAAMGLLLLPDVAARLQAATKPQVVGLLLVVVGAAPFLGLWSAVAMLALVAVFQLVTAPVLAQLLARSAYRSGSWRRDRLLVDELAESRHDDDA